MRKKKKMWDHPGMWGGRPIRWEEKRVGVPKRKKKWDECPLRVVGGHFLGLDTFIIISLLIWFE